MAFNTLQSAYIDLIADGGFTHALTLKPNAMSSQAVGPVFHISSGSQCETLLAPRISTSRNAAIGRQIHNSDEMLFSRLERFATLFDRKLVGRRFNEQKNSHLRTKFMAVAEGDRTTGHLHCAMKVHPDRAAKFITICLPEGRDSFAGVCVGIRCPEAERWSSKTSTMREGGEPTW